MYFWGQGVVVFGVVFEVVGGVGSDCYSKQGIGQYVDGGNGLMYVNFLGQIKMEGQWLERVLRVVMLLVRWLVVG